MSRQTYLLIDLLSVLVPVIASFHPSSRLYRRWYALLPAIGVTTVGYCVWDAWFTHKGVWGFNRAYLLGIYIWNLPVEEVLFFVCIPYACVFTFDSASKLFPIERATSRMKFFNYFLVAALAGLAIIYYPNYYSVTAFTIPAVIILMATIKEVQWMRRFYLVYGVLMIPFMIVNGLLTGTGLRAPIVWYNPGEIIGLRILTIPIEDVFYGMGLILINVWIYQGILHKNNRPATALQKK
ncbi:MAG: lycopene cyclase domain-containing protein [Mucilaginibacter sp.]